MQARPPLAAFALVQICHMQQSEINRLKSAAVPAQRLFVGGRLTAAGSEACLDVVSSIDSRMFTTIASSDARDIDLAVWCARQAFDAGSCSRAAPAHRKKIGGFKQFGSGWDRSLHVFDGYADLKTAWISL